MDKTARNLIIFGALLSVIGVIILVLQFTTNVFKKDTLISAGSVITDGLAVAKNAFITWDDTSIVMDSTGVFVRWSSTRQFTDSDSSSQQYTYDLVPCAYSADFIPVPAAESDTTIVYSNSGLPGVCTSSTTYLGRVPSKTQTWNSYPSLNTPHSVFIVGKTETGVSTGGFVYASTGDADQPFTKILAQLQCNAKNDAILTDMGNLTHTVGIPFESGIIKYSSGTQVASCIFGYEYNGGLSCTPTSGLCTDTTNPKNGQLTTRVSQVSSSGAFDTMSTDTTMGVKQRSGQPYVSVNRAPGVGVASNIHCILVFKRVLTDAQRTSLFAYLNDKYFKPEMVYPKTFTATVGSALSVPIVNGGKIRDPVTYSIQPALPVGLTFTEGTISGTPIQFTPAMNYTITGKNNVTSNVAVINIGVESAAATGAATKTTSTPPNVTYTNRHLTLNQVVSLQPSNVGDKVTKFTIRPTNIAELTGLTFDHTTGILSGTVTTSANIAITISATNDNGTAESSFELKTGLLMEYTSTSIDVMINQPCEPLQLKLLVNDQSRLTLLSYTGDLFGLSFNSTTGDISGTPNRVGTSHVTITAKFSDGTSASTDLNVRVSKHTKVSVDPGIIIGAGSVATAVGAGLLGYGAYLSLKPH